MISGLEGRRRKGVGDPQCWSLLAFVVLLGWIMTLCIIEVKPMVFGVVVWIVKIYEKTVKPLDLA
jgi:hypothetical protein